MLNEVNPMLRKRAILWYVVKVKFFKTIIGYVIDFSVNCIILIRESRAKIKYVETLFVREVIYIRSAFLRTNHSTIQKTK